MAFRPQTAEQIAETLASGHSSDRSVHDSAAPEMAYRLAVIACGGQSLETDRVAQRLRNALPEYLAAIARAQAEGR